MKIIEPNSSLFFLHRTLEYVAGGIIFTSSDNVKGFIDKMLLTGHPRKAFFPGA